MRTKKGAPSALADDKQVSARVCGAHCVQKVLVREVLNEGAKPVPEGLSTASSTGLYMLQFPRAGGQS